MNPLHKLMKRPALTNKVIRGLQTIYGFTDAEIRANSYVEQMGEEFQPKQDEADHANRYLMRLIQWHMYEKKRPR